jgi:hypothetical protein
MALWTTGSLPVGWPGWFSFHAAGTYRYADPAATDHVGRVLIRVGASPRRGTTSTHFTITWADVPAESGLGYDVQVRAPAGRWRWWRVGVVEDAGSFRPHAGRGTYRFRARPTNAAGHAAWSPVTEISVR